MPKASTTRSRRKADRPAELLDAALDTFVERGFAAARMGDIAERAGVSKGTIYLYYTSKEAIFEALVRRNIIPRLEAAEAALRASGLPAAVQLRRLLELMAEATADPRIAAVPKLVLSEAGNFPEMARFYRNEVVGRGLALVQGILRRGMDGGELRALDPELTARLFVAPMILSALWQTSFAPIEEAPVPPASLIALHLDLFLGAIAAPDGPT
ncbi:TetR/AcrR family transcriptional regulator [Roseococcus sp. YIM B11640]|uniref:TetR/AcrR family transcriptional regulator n=1 Tax=Roseococcus sp. YIM B11640 TaxID=3133973 RepID=UPI003C7C46B6